MKPYSLSLSPSSLLLCSASIPAICCSVAPLSPRAIEDGLRRRSNQGIPTIPISPVWTTIEAEPWSQLCRSTCFLPHLGCGFWGPLSSISFSHRITSQGLVR